MRVYHFVAERFGLDDIRRRRLKIATLHELNDPFEFYGANLGDEAFRAAIRLARNEFGKQRGFLCFSRSWHNPVQWSHYANKHRGLCLAFDIRDEHLTPILYASARARVGIGDLVKNGALDADVIRQLMFTKYSHWRYENEVRALARLDAKDARTNLYFADFGADLRLAVVIVGAQSSVTRRQLTVALGALAPHVAAFKARLAFQSFRVVRQRNSKLWM